MIAQSFSAIVEFVIPIRIPTNQVKAEKETHSVIEEPEMRKCLL